jgi:hypothetical protein
MIYTNKQLKYRQIPIPSSDLTAIIALQGQEILLIISAYIEYQANTRQNRYILEQSLQYIQATLQKVQETKPNTKLILAGNFNRHDILWGGQRAFGDRQGEAEPILQFITEYQLWSALL